MPEIHECDTTPLAREMQDAGGRIYDLCNLLRTVVEAELPEKASTTKQLLFLVEHISDIGTELHDTGYRELNPLGDLVASAAAEPADTARSRFIPAFRAQTVTVLLSRIAASL